MKPPTRRDKGMAITRGTLLRYGSAILAIVLATVIRLVLDPITGGRHPVGVFFLAIVFAAWYGGFGPSLVALALSLAAIPLSSRAAQGSPFLWVVETRVNSGRY